MREKWNLPDEAHFRHSVPDWLLVLMQKSNKDQRGLILMLLWRAWHLRNEIVHENRDSPIRVSCEFLVNYAIGLKPVTDKTDSLKGKAITKAIGPALVNHTTRPKPLEVSAWTPPPDGWLKVNVDAAFDPNSELAAAGIIVRDSTGHVIGAAASPLKNCLDATAAEAAAILFAVQQLVGVCAGPVIIENDCAQVINWLNSNEKFRCKEFAILRETLSSCRFFSSLTFQKTGRLCNHAAHDLAAFAQASRTFNFWLGPVPPFILNLACKDYVTGVSV